LPQTELLAWVHELCGRLGVTESRSRVLRWEELRRLKQQGVTLAPHSRTHPDMSRLTREEARKEIAGSFEDLQKEVGTILPVFAYPGGYYNTETVMALAQESFSLAFATLRGTNDLEKASEGLTRFELRRNHIDAEASLPVLQSRLLYASRFLNQWHTRRKHKRGYES
jgi:peptidoglycan/xylan/chitin deacetylase (PgdA/CDA1 family)